MLNGFSKFMAFDQIAQFDLRYQKIIVTIGQLQMLTLFYPDDGWNIWSYSNNAFKIVKNTLNASLIFPYLKKVESEILVKVLLLFLFTINFYIILMIFYFGRFYQLNQKSQFNKRCLQYQFLIQKLLILPYLYFYLQVLTFNERGILYKQFDFDPFIFIAILGLIFLFIIYILGHYFYRSRLLYESLELQQKYTRLGIMSILIQIVVVYLHFLERSKTFNILRNLFMHCYYGLSMLNSYKNFIYPPKINQYYVTLLSICLGFLFVISINLISNIIKEYDIIIYQLILTTFLGSLINIMLERKQMKIIFQEQNQFSQEIIQFIFYLMPNLIQDKKFYSRNLKLLYFVFLENYQKTSLNCKMIQQITYGQSKKLVFLEIFKCILDYQQEVCSQYSNQEIQQLEIYKIELISKFKQSPLQAFVEQKKFLLSHKNKLSIYTQIVLDLNQKQLQSLINQRNNESVISNLPVKGQIELKDFLIALSMEEKFINFIHQLLDRKIDIWNNLISGIQSILQLQFMIVQYSKKLKDCFQELKSELNFSIKSSHQIDQKKNVLELKILSFFHLAVLNDNFSSLQYEKRIQEILVIENAFAKKFIQSIDLLEDNICLIQVSMVQNRGEIINKKKNLIADFFGYQFQEVASLIKINQIIPAFFNEIHDQLFLRYLEVAQSHLIQEHSMIFSQLKDEMLQACELKLENDFMNFEDFVLVGCLKKIKQQSEFILFDTRGKIISITQRFAKLVKSTTFSTERFITKLSEAYVFLFFPDLFQIIQQLQDNIKLKLSSQIDGISNLVLLNFQSIINIQRFESTLEINQISVQQKALTISDEEILQSASNYYLRQQQKYQFTSYPCNINLSFKIIGYESTQQKSFFILELKDFQSQYYPELGKQKSEIIHDNQQQNQREISDNFPEKDKLLQTMNIMSLENQNMIPNSQRAHLFTSRLTLFDEESKKQEYLLKDLRKSFNTICPEQYLDNAQNFEQDKDKEKQKQYITIHNLIPSNNQKLKKVVTDLQDQNFQIAENQSYSKSAQDTSKQQYIDIIKYFQYSKQRTKGLIIISFLKFITILFLVSSILGNIETIQQQNYLKIINSKQSNGPLLFNRYFFQSYSLSWILLMNSLKIVNYSEFSSNQTFSALGSMEKDIFENLMKMYPTFIEIEEIGLLPNISLKLIGMQRQTVLYTEFINIIENHIKNYFSIRKTDYIETDWIKNLDFIKSLIVLRYNLKYVFEMNKDLIYSLDQLGQVQMLYFIKQIQDITIIEIIIIYLLIFSQIFFWKTVLNWKQKTLIINTRLKEIDVSKMIVKHKFYQKLLLSQDRQNNWKNQFIGHIDQDSFQNYHSKYKSTMMYITDQKIEQQEQKKNQNAMLKKNQKEQIFFIQIFFKFYFSFSHIVILFIWQIIELGPLQKETSNFLRFSSYLDTLITGALVIKTQPIVYQEIVQNKLLTQEQLDANRDPQKQLFHMFLDVYETYDQNITLIFQNILISEFYNNEDKRQLLSLFEQDLCLILYEQIPFCQLKNIGQEQFESKYSNYYNIDNGLNYLSQGLYGIVSDINKLMKTNYNFEIENIQYSTDTNHLIQLLNSQEFQNIIIQHFSTVAKSTELILEIFLKTKEQLMSQQNQDILLYFILAGILLLLLFIYGSLKLINYEYQNIQNLRLGLTLVPQEILINEKTIQHIKRLI